MSWKMQHKNDFRHWFWHTHAWLRYVLSRCVLMKCNFRVVQRSTRVSALIVRELWKLFSPSEHLHWSNDAKRLWMILLPVLQWAVLGPWTCWVEDNEICDELARDSSLLEFGGPDSALGVSRQDIRRRIRHWLVDQHRIWWWGLGDTQRQAWELIAGHNPELLLAFLLDIILWGDMFTWWGYQTVHCVGGVEQRLISAHILCECDTFASLRHAYLGSFSWSQRTLRV